MSMNNAPPINRSVIHVMNIFSFFLTAHQPKRFLKSIYDSILYSIEEQTKKWAEVQKILCQVKVGICGATELLVGFAGRD